MVSIMDKNQLRYEAEQQLIRTCIDLGFIQIDLNAAHERGDVPAYYSRVARGIGATITKLEEIKAMVEQVQKLVMEE